MATSAGFLPPSICLDISAKESAKMEQSTVLTIETFCDEPTARNSKRWPPYGKGEVRLRSSAGTWTAGTPPRPRSSSLLFARYGSTEMPFRNESR